MYQITSNDIETMIQEDMNIVDILKNRLDDEVVAITTRDYQKISTLITEKEALTKQLQANADKRRHWLAPVYKEVSQKNWQHFLSSFNQDHLVQQWEILQGKIAICQKNNTRNGLLINRGVKTHQSLINIMKGQKSHETLYTATGKTSPLASSYQMAKA